MKIDYIVQAGDLGEIDCVVTYLTHGNGRDEPKAIELRSCLWQGIDILDHLGDSAKEALLDEISYCEGSFVYDRRAA